VLATQHGDEGRDSLTPGMLSPPTGGTVPPVGGMVSKVGDAAYQPREASQPEASSSPW
jgi:hypothetical protein